MSLGILGRRSLDVVFPLLDVLDHDFFRCVDGNAPGTSGGKSIVTPQALTLP